jgi:hypothetical protein
VRPTGGFLAAPGSARQVVLSELESVVQMLPIEHGEKAETFFSETGAQRLLLSFELQHLQRRRELYHVSMTISNASLRKSLTR